MINTAQIMLILFLIISNVIIVNAQISAGTIDDFKDTTVQGWAEGGITTNPNPPSNVSSGGPLGSGDNYLENISSGGFGVGSKWIMFNNAQWTGNFMSSGIDQIKLFVNSNNSTISFRISFEGGGNQFSSINAVAINTGTFWTEITLPILSSNLTLVSGIGPYNATMNSVTEMRLLHNSSSPSWSGEAISATVSVDNIKSVNSTLNDEDEFLSVLKIYPNPVIDFFKIDLTNEYKVAKIEVYDIYGKHIIEEKTSNGIKGVDVSSLNSGVYVLKISSNSKFGGHKFIKMQ